MSSPATATDLRTTLLARLADARRMTDALFETVRPEALYDRPIPERHRIVFYIGHLEAFDWNLIARRTFDIPAFHEGHDRLFAFGIDPVDGQLPSDVPADWPTLDEVRAYGERVRTTIDTRLASADLADPRQPNLQDGLVIDVALEHRLMHAETLAYMLHQLPTDRKIAHRDPTPPTGRDLAGRMASIPAGTATLGLRRGSAFGWDNEFEEHTVRVPAFQIDAGKVTNGEWLAFMDAGGYAKRDLWTDADWAWKQEAGISHPAFWVRDGNAWHWQGMFERTPVPRDWPVYVSQAEASAYARWKGGTLPTEAQFHRAAYGTPTGEERAYPWGDAPPAARHGNFDFQRWDPAPVGAYPDGDSAFGVADLVGNGWEWTSTVFGPFEGFERFPFYEGYSANFFDGKHYVIKGGASRTAACMLRRSFRNWFQGHYPYVYAGFRCVRG